MDRRCCALPAGYGAESGQPRNMAHRSGTPRSDRAASASALRTSASRSFGQVGESVCDAAPSVRKATRGSRPNWLAVASRPPHPSVSSSGWGARTTIGERAFNWLSSSVRAPALSLRHVSSPIAATTGAATTAGRFARRRASGTPARRGPTPGPERAGAGTAPDPGTPGRAGVLRRRPWCRPFSWPRP